MTISASQHGTPPLSSSDEAERQVESLWHAVCDLYPGIEVASRHALDDFELRPEDMSALDSIRELRHTFERCQSMPGLTIADGHFLADIDQRITSLEGRAEILVLAVS